jgi:hypothetical protein
VNGPGVTSHPVKAHTPLSHHGLNAGVTTRNCLCLQAVIRGGQGLAIQLGAIKLPGGGGGRRSTKVCAEDAAGSAGAAHIV